MKSLLILLILCFPFIAVGAPCDGAPGRYHVNPDGSQGGFVQKTAVITKETFLDTTSEICDKAIIKGKAHIEVGTRIRENVIIDGGPTIQGSHIFGYAQIKGRAVIQNSEICQGSLVEGFKVINSNYYCQTEDPQPKDPGAENFKTLLGVDSDGDGVRDDVERFINRMLSNTPKQNKAKERIASKLLAKILQKEIILRSNPEIIKSLYAERVYLVLCHGITINDDIYLEMYDTEDRIIALTKISGATHGQEPQDFNKTKCKSIKDINASINSK